MNATRQVARTPALQQMEEADCAATCLRIVLSHWGRHVSGPQMRELIGGGRDGVSGAHLSRAATALGMVVRAKRVSTTTTEPMTHLLRSLEGPAIALLKGHHFAVIEGIDRRGRVYMNDPAQGRSVRSAESVLSRLSGIVLTLAPGVGFRESGVLPSPIRTLVGWLRPQRRRAMIAAVLSLISTCVLGACAIGMRAVINSESSEDLWVPLGLLWVGIAISAIIVFAQQSALSRLLTDLSLQRSTRIAAQLLSLPSRFFHNRFVGALAGRPQVADSLANTVARTMLPGLSAAGSAVLVAVALGIVSWPALACTALAGAVRLTLTRRAGVVDESTQAELVAVQSMKDAESMATLNMIDSVIAEGSGAHLLDKWVGDGHVVNELTARSARTQASYERIGLLSDAGFLVAGLLATVLIWPEAGLGGVVMAMPLMTILSTHVQTAGAWWRARGRDRAMLEQLLDVSDNADRLTAIDNSSARRGGDHGAPEASLSSHRDPSQHLTITNLSAGYDRNRAPVIAGLTTAIERGRRLVVVGPSGIGKSTLAKVITGQLEPMRGVVSIDGMPIDQIDPGARTSLIGYVPQKPTFLEGTVAEAIAFGGAVQVDERLNEVLALVRLDRLIAARGGVHEARLTHHGSNFSGGERQRLAIARALYRQPQLLVLDEATSALEPALAAEIEAMLRELGITSVVIAHRQSAISDDDTILRFGADGVFVLEQPRRTIAAPTRPMEVAR